MELLDLPLEILKTLLEHFVNTVGLWKAAKYRLISKLFDREIISAIFATQIIDRDPRGASAVINSPLNLRYLQIRTSTSPRSRKTNRFRLAVDLTVDLLVESAHVHNSRHSRDELTTVLHILALERPRHLLDLLDDQPFEASYKGEDTAATGGGAEENHLAHYDYKHLLAAAAYTGNVSLVKTLLHDGVDMREGSEYFGTPVPAAASRGFNDILVLLLEHDAGTRVENEILEARLPERLFMEPECPSVALVHASSAGHAHTVHLLLEPKYNIDTSGRRYAAAAVEAAAGGHSALVRLLIDFGRGQMKYPVRLQEEMVLKAAKCGQDGVIRLLLDEGTSPDCTDYQTRTPLEFAAMKGHADVAELLLKRGADPHAGYDYPLILASRYGHKRIAEMLLDCGANINKVIYPAPIAAAAMHGQAHMVSFLVERGADLQYPSKEISGSDVTPANGVTAINFAAYEGWETIVSMLVKYGVTMDETVDGSPMENAIRGGHDHVVKRLTELGAKTTIQVP